MESPSAASWTLVPLRAFLGFTFSFAGMQKLANPGFFSAANPASIQSQLAGAVRSSPVHALISPLTHVAVPLGVLIALSELAIGIGTLLGLWQRAAAAGGVLLALMLFLTVSFHSSPYYTGADIVFVFAWTPLLLAGAGPVLSADAAIAARQTDPRNGITRKGALTALAALGGLVIAGVTAGIGRLAGGTSTSSPVTLPRVAPTGTSAPSTPASHHHAGGHLAGQVIGPASDVPVGGAASFTDPSTGNPSIVLHPEAGRFLAFSAVCPHAGCTVGYSQAAKLIVCPCHGSEFNPATGARRSGPALTGLKPIRLQEIGGQLYAE